MMIIPDKQYFVKVEPIPHRTRYILIDGSFSLKDSGIAPGLVLTRHPLPGFDSHTLW